MTTGMTLRNAFYTIDPAVRFRTRSGIASAGEISRMRRIPGDFLAPIYMVLEDEDGYLYIGIAPSPSSDNWEWRNDQIDTPLFKSIDRVDLLGHVIQAPDSIGDNP